MVSINTVILGGHLGADPEEKRLPNGKLLCSFRLAVNRWESKTEEEVVDWHSVVAFERQAEVCLKYLRKGAPVLIEGRLHVRQWDGADGKKQTRCEVTATRVSFLGSRATGEARSEMAREARSEMGREARSEERPIGARPTALAPHGFADQVPF